MTFVKAKVCSKRSAKEVSQREVEKWGDVGQSVQHFSYSVEWTHSGYLMYIMLAKVNSTELYTWNKLEGLILSVFIIYKKKKIVTMRNNEYVN